MGPSAFIKRNVAVAAIAATLALCIAAPAFAATKRVTTGENGVGVIVPLKKATGPHAIAVPPRNGSAILQDDKIVYTPDAGFTGLDSILYTSQGSTKLNTVMITVAPDAATAIAPPTVSIVLVGADSKPFMVRGLIMRPVIAPSATVPAPFKHFDDAELSAAAAWGANTVRLLASQGALDPLGPNYSAQYVQAVANAATQVLEHGFVLIIGVNDEPTDDTTTTRNCLPTAATQRAWATLLAMPFADAANEGSVLLELFNEPVTADKSAASWQLWQNGGTVAQYTAGVGTCLGGDVVGMNTLIADVRTAGAQNIVIADGLGWAHWLNPKFPVTDSLNRIAYAAHPFLENWTGFALNGDPAHDTPILNAAFGNMQSQGPVIATAVGGGGGSSGTDAEDCFANAPQIMPTLMAYLWQNNMGAVGWAFDLPPHSLTTGWGYNPTSYVDYQCPTDTSPGQGGPGELFQQWFATGN